METLFHAMADNWFWTVMGVVAITAITFGCIKEASKVKARERTRREIAAYIAEGSMTPEQGERLMRASDESADE